MIEFEFEGGRGRRRLFAEGKLLAEATTDEEYARELREELKLVLAEACEIIDRARDERGLIVQFKVAPGPDGRNVVHGIDVIKAF